MAAKDKYLFNGIDVDNPNAARKYIRSGKNKSERFKRANQIQRFLGAERFRSPSDLGALGRKIGKKGKARGTSSGGGGGGG